MTALEPNETYALVVGIEKYAVSAAWNLEGPANAAYRFAQWLVRQGVPANNVSLFLSPLDGVDKEPLLHWPGEVPPATSDNLRAALTTELPAKRGSILFLFWSGHGAIPHGNEDRRLFLADATQGHMRNLAVKDILSLLRSSSYPAFPYQVCFIDACATNPDTGEVYRMPPEALPQRADWIRGREQFTLLAASPGQTALTLSHQQTTLFTQALIERLEASPQGSWPPPVPQIADDLVKYFAQLHDSQVGQGGIVHEQIPDRIWYHSPRGGNTEVSLVPLQPAGVCSPSTVNGAPPMDNNQLSSILSSRFSKDELKDLCWHLNVDYDDLPGDDTRIAKARELVQYFQRRAGGEQLRTAICTLRPDVCGSSFPPPDDSVVRAEPQPGPTMPAPQNGGVARVSLDLLTLQDMLLKCDSIENRQKRRVVLSQLPDEIRHNIADADDNGTHVYNIVKTCSNYENGLRHLVETMQRLEGNSMTLKEVNQYLERTR